MPRPPKNNCDYFPHDRDMRDHKKVKAIRSKFGISGYAIWVMMLEYLTGCDGNEFEYSNLEFELMAGDFGVSATDIRDVVDYCISLEMLFNRNGFIHSESLDERLLPVYEKRGRAKEFSKKQIRKNGKFTRNNTDTIGITVTEIPQSKVNKIKEKESKVNETKTPLPFDSLEFQNAWVEWEKYRKEIRKKLTPSTAKKQIAFLGGRGEAEAIAIINQSIANGWTGLFDLKKQNYDRTTNQNSNGSVGSKTFSGKYETHL